MPDLAGGENVRGRPVGQRRQHVLGNPCRRTAGAAPHFARNGNPITQYVTMGDGASSARLTGADLAAATALLVAPEAVSFYDQMSQSRER